MKKFMFLLFSCSLAFSAHAATVTVNGAGGADYTTISAAYAGLNRADSQADVINVLGGTFETASLAINCSGVNTDSLMINGDPLFSGTNFVVVYADTIGMYANEITVQSGSGVAIRNLTMIPAYTASGNFLHSVMNITDTGAPVNIAVVELSNVTLTSSTTGSVPVAVDAATLPAGMLNWYTPGSPADCGGIRIDTTYGASNFSANFSDVEVGYAYCGFHLMHRDGCTVTMTNCKSVHGSQNGVLVTNYLNSSVLGSILATGGEFSDNAGVGFDASACNSPVSFSGIVAKDNGNAGASIGTSTGYVSSCEFTGNGSYGLSCGSSISSTIIGGKFNSNTMHGLEVGASDCTVSGGSQFCDNNQDGINVGSSSGTLTCTGNDSSPVVIANNTRRGVYTSRSDNEVDFTYTVFAGNKILGVFINEIDMDSDPTFTKCAFVNNGATNPIYHGQVNIQDTNPLTASIFFNQCTFYNTPGIGEYAIVIDDTATKNLTIDLDDCIFAADENTERAVDIYSGGVGCRAFMTYCAFVTEGPYALASSYLSSGTYSEFGSTHADPDFASVDYSDYTALASTGDFLRVRSNAYINQGTGSTDLSGYNSNGTLVNDWALY